MTGPLTRRGFLTGLAGFGAAPMLLKPPGKPQKPKPGPTTTTTRPRVIAAFKYSDNVAVKYSDNTGVVYA